MWHKRLAIKHFSRRCVLPQSLWQPIFLRWKNTKLVLYYWWNSKVFKFTKKFIKIVIQCWIFVHKNIIFQFPSSGWSDFFHSFWKCVIFGKKCKSDGIYATFCAILESKMAERWRHQNPKMLLFAEYEVKTSFFHWKWD